MTKKEAYELVIDRLSGGDPSAVNKYHPEIVYKNIELARNFMIKVEFNEARNAGTYDINGEFISAFNCVPVKYDECRDEYYSKLPGRIISLPMNRGLRSVSPTKGQQTPFNIVPNGSAGVFEGLEAQYLAGTECYVEGDKIYYRALDHANVKQVLIKMVASINDLDEDEQIPIPADKETMLLDKVVEMLTDSKVTIQDKHNDSNTEQTV